MLKNETLKHKRYGIYLCVKKLRNIIPTDYHIN